MSRVTVATECATVVDLMADATRYKEGIKGVCFPF